MESRETKGHLAQSKNDHLTLGSSGSDFENLIPGLKPDIPYGEQMTPQALQAYYDMQLGGMRGYLGLTPEQRRSIIGLIEGFELDLPYLEEHGIDITEARSIFETLKGS